MIPGQGYRPFHGRSRRRFFSVIVVSILLGCLLWCSLPGVAGGRSDGDADGNEAVWADALSPCVVYLDDDSSDKYITGTLLYSSGPVVVTNYHVLSSSTDTLHVYLATEKGVERFDGVFVKGDRENDLAAVRIRLGGRTIEPLHPVDMITAVNAETAVADRYLVEENFAEPFHLRRGYDVIFLGFPLNYGITTDDRGGLLKKPLLRSGKIASGIMRGEFFIDAMVSNGNSGSPVFVRVARKKGNRRSFSFRLAGVIKQYQQDIIKVRLGGRPADIPHNTGLGIVVPIDTVKDFLKNMPQ